MAKEAEMTPVVVSGELPPRPTSQPAYIEN